jgi:hypothetical protein
MEGSGSITSCATDPFGAENKVSMVSMPASLAPSRIATCVRLSYRSPRRDRRISSTSDLGEALGTLVRTCSAAVSNDRLAEASCYSSGIRSSDGCGYDAASRRMLIRKRHPPMPERMVLGGKSSNLAPSLERFERLARLAENWRSVSGTPLNLYGLSWHP